MDDRTASGDAADDLEVDDDIDLDDDAPPCDAPAGAGHDDGCAPAFGEPGPNAFPPVTPPTTRDPDDPYRSPQWRDLPWHAYPENDRLSNRLVAHLPRNVRNHLMGKRFDALERLDELDAALEALSRERLALLDNLDDLRATLWPIDPRSKGRRPPADHERALAPAADDARLLAGRRLRSMCMSILRRHGPLRLRDLHDLLHRYGYAVGGTEPVKVLADALGYEHDCGRARRIARGVYDADRRPGRGGPRGHGRDPLQPLAIRSEPAAAEPSHEGPPDPDLVDDLDSRVTPPRAAGASTSATAQRAPHTVRDAFTSGSPTRGRRATRPPYGATRYHRDQPLRPRRAPP